MKNRDVKIVTGMRFRDNQGCLLETVKPSVLADEWWCKGVPDVIGEWKYCIDTIKRGLIRGSE